MAYWIASCFFSLSMYVITNLALYHMGQHLSWVVLCLAGYWSFRIYHAVLQIWFTASYLKNITFPMISIFNLSVKSALHASLLADSQKMSVVMYTITGQKGRGRKELHFVNAQLFVSKKGYGGFLQKYAFVSRYCLLIVGGRGQLCRMCTVSASEWVKDSFICFLFWLKTSCLTDSPALHSQ